MKKTALNTLKKLWSDESGQGATEYILLLVVVVGIAMLFKDKIRGAVDTKLNDLNGQIQGFTGGN
jgi:Flp pilus assembly pilin Flp